MTVSLLSIFFKRAAVQNGLTLFSSFKINVLIYECVWIFKLVYYNGSYLYNTHTDMWDMFKNLTQALMAWNYPPPPQPLFKLYVYIFIFNKNVLFHFLFLYFSCSCPYIYIACNHMAITACIMSDLYSLIIPRYTLRCYNKILWIYGHGHDR